MGRNTPSLAAISCPGCGASLPVDASGVAECAHCSRREQLDPEVVERLRAHLALVRSMEDWVNLRNRRSMASRGQPRGRRAEIEWTLFLVWNVSAFVALVAALSNESFVASAAVVVLTAAVWWVYLRRYRIEEPPVFAFGDRAFRVATCPRCGGSVAATATVPACPFCRAELALPKKVAADVRRAMFDEVEAERARMASEETE